MPSRHHEAVVEYTTKNAGSVLNDQVHSGKNDTYYASEVLNSTAIEEILTDAKAATEYELNMKLWDGIKTYPRAVAWSVLICFTLIMEGFDQGLAFIALPSFNKKFGHFVGGKKGYQLPAQWQVGLSMGALSGQTVGLFASGLIADRYGQRKTMIINFGYISAVIFILFFAQDKQTILAGKILFGVAIGGFQSVTSAYVAEVCPVTLRGYLTTFIAVCWKVGELIAASAMRGVDSMERPDAWRIPLALQWIWPLPLAIGVYFAPESPWWLVKKNRHEDAMRSLQRLDNRTDEERRKTLAMIVHTVTIENEVRDSTTYMECFRGTNLRRTEISAFTFLAQSFSGTILLGHSTYFMEQAGLSSKYSFDLSIVSYVLGIIGCIVVWFAMKRFGRRQIYLNGLIWQWILLLLIGILGVIPNRKGSSWGVGVLLLIMMGVYSGGVGCVIYTIGAELPAGKLRTKTIVISRGLYYMGNIVGSILTPYMINPTAWNWGAKAGFFWLGLDTLCIIYVFFRLPETKGRTFAQIDVMFEQGIAPRKFSSYEFDLFENTKIADEE